MKRQGHYLVLLCFGACLVGSVTAQELFLPLKEKSIRFGVIGDSGTGGKGQYQVAQQIVEYRKKFPFDFAIMLGDNMYGGESSKDYIAKFELPYKPLLEGGVKFYAALGNHDNPNERFYKPFNMNQSRYYTYTKGDVRFFVLDSNYMDSEQLKWLETELERSSSPWRVCYFHHPLYSSGARHGSDTDLRVLIEPLFIKYRVNVVFAGHEHFYERLKPQNGIHYFTSGAAGKLRKGNILDTEIRAKGFDQDLSFMLVEISGDDLYFQVISRTGQTVDSGSIQRPIAKAVSDASK